MSIVYVVQNQMMADSTNGQLVPKYPSLQTQASKFGEVRFLLGPSASPWGLKTIIPELMQSLTTFSDEDYLLFIGNQTFFAIAGAIALGTNDGRMKILQWSRKDGGYLPIQIDLNSPV